MDEAKKVVDEKLMIEVTPDKMIAAISFQEAVHGGRRLTLDQIRRELANKGIVYGIDEAVLSEISSSRKPGFKYIIAKGLVPQKGQDAEHKFHFDVAKLNAIKPKENNDGTVDFKDLNIIYNVTKGEVLYEKIPATEGVNGRNIFAKEILGQRGKDIRLPKGKNVDLLDDGKTLVAGIDGRLCYDGHNIYISPLFIIEEDVDSSTGNIDFVGNVLIHGSVKNGFSVKAKGNIEIHGSVEAAQIEADGDVLIWYGFQGMDKGSIKAGGNIVAKFIQNATVEATGDITAEAIMHSQVAANNIYVNKGKGCIVGGKVVAGHLILAYIIGSSMATRTEIHIGIPPHIMSEYKEVETEYLAVIEDLNKIGKSVAFLTSKQAKEQLSADKFEMLKKLLVTRQQASDKKGELGIRYSELKEMIHDVASGMVKVRDTLYPGVKVIMGNAIKYIKEDTQHCSVQKQDGDIIIGLY